MGWLEKLFHLRESGTTVQREVLAGLTTFLTMSYIIFVNPAILSASGMDKGAVMVATCICAGAWTMLTCSPCCSPSGSRVQACPRM
jgi:AGZA family xanthine/uracil permease-like MFS transporter